MENKNHGTPGKGAKVDRVPQNGAGNEFGEAERFGWHDGTVPVHAPDPDDDREPAI